MEEQAHPVPGHGDIVPVREAEQHPAAAGVDADDPVREAAGVRDAVDDDGGAGDRAARADLPRERVRSRAETP